MGIREPMDLKRPVVVLALVGFLAGPLAACGENSDVNRNEEGCGTAEAARDEECEDTEDGPGTDD